MKNALIAAVVAAVVAIGAASAASGQQQQPGSSICWWQVTEPLPQLQPLRFATLRLALNEEKNFLTLHPSVPATVQQICFALPQHQ